MSSIWRAVLSDGSTLANRVPPPPNRSSDGALPPDTDSNPRNPPLSGSSCGLLDRDKSGNVEPALSNPPADPPVEPPCDPIDPMEPIALGAGPPDFAIPRSEDC